MRSNDKPDQSKVFKNSAAIEKLLERIEGQSWTKYIQYKDGVNNEEI